MSLVTRAMGLAAMTDAERDAYLHWVRCTANSQLACLFRDMLRQGVLRAGARVHRAHLATLEVPKGAFHIIFCAPYPIPSHIPQYPDCTDFS